MAKKIVFWKNKHTGKTGHGESMEEELANAWVDYGNREYPYIKHQTVDVDDPMLELGEGESI